MDPASLHRTATFRKRRATRKVSRNLPRQRPANRPPPNPPPSARSSSRPWRLPNPSEAPSQARPIRTALPASQTRPRPHGDRSLRRLLLVCSFRLRLVPPDRLGRRTERVDCCGCRRCRRWTRRSPRRGGSGRMGVTLRPWSRSVKSPDPEKHCSIESTRLLFDWLPMLCDHVHVLFPSGLFLYNVPPADMLVPFSKSRYFGMFLPCLIDSARSLACFTFLTLTTDVGSTNLLSTTT